jgi:NAD(P)-dependent dehydrogenase (short-subunit alcohol dehydrogenase family)
LNHDDFLGRRALVTGADSLAAVIAEGLATRGAQVHVCDLRADAVAACTTRHVAIDGSVADMSRADEVLRVAREALERLGGIDLLFNVVGVAGPIALTEDVAVHDWRSTFAVNVEAPLLLMQQVLPGMKQRRFGAIVNISTASVVPALPRRSAYVASKVALEALTRNVAREAGPFGVRCNAIRPGAMDNARMRAIFQAQAERLGQSIEVVMAESLRYQSIPELIALSEVASMAIYLCSDAARHVTGQMIGVDGNTEWED